MNQMFVGTKLRVTSHRLTNDFKAQFYDPIELALDNNVRTSVNLSILKIVDCQFDLSSLYGVLENTSASFVLTSKEYEGFIKEPFRFMTVSDRVRSSFREPDSNAGEGGELILYGMLESYNGAPKILSKMNLKTDSQKYVNGSDGVHLMQVDDDSFQIIFGESKMYADLSAAIKAAFKSIASIKDENFYSDKTLVNSQLLNEYADPDMVDILDRVFLLNRSDPRKPKVGNAFGVLLGFELDVTDYDINIHTDEEVEREFLSRAQEAFEEKLPLIGEEIRDHGLGGHHIHIYSVPFLKKRVADGTVGIEDVRRDLQNVLRNGRLH